MSARTPRSEAAPARKPRTAQKAHRDALGSVEKLPSGRYRARYSRDGETFKAPRTFATKADALNWLAAERSDRARGSWLDPRLGKELLTEYARSWLASRADLSPRTLDLYARTLDAHILPRVGGARGGVELGALALAEITPAVVRTWRGALLTDIRERIATRSQRAKGRTIHPARAWAKRQGIEVPPTGRISPKILDAWEKAGAPGALRRPPQIVDDSHDPGRTTAAIAYRTLRTILNAAVTDGLIQVNPCQIAGAGTTQPSERPTATPAEVERIADLMPAHLRAAVLLAAWSGLRFGELFALSRAHVNLDSGTVRVERALIAVPGQPVKFGKPKTQSSRRTVHLPGFVVETLRAHLAAFVPTDPTALVFTTLQGEPITTPRLAQAYQRARAQAGRADLRWHDLRHTGATLAYSTGASVREVQNRLGHSTMRAAAIYSHASEGSDRVLADRLDALYSPTARVA
ncbi:tyrosine-type recombinase/integrase [Leucobacter sp. W1038]|uniref:tyrosine-type recombinase/integrase n=1 Tax=Leucobacter sp. W1038 TaxID=3438281 RepID=UPI003D9656C6